MDHHHNPGPLKGASPPQEDETQADGPGLQEGSHKTADEVYAAAGQGSKSADFRRRVLRSARHEPRRAPFEPTPRVVAETLRQLLAARPGVAAETQAQRLIAAMEAVGEVSRLEAEIHLGIGHCCRRIADLADAGYVIDRRWVEQISAAGSSHRTVKYSINSKPEKC